MQLGRSEMQRLQKYIKRLHGILFLRLSHMVHTACSGQAYDRLTSSASTMLPIHHLKSSIDERGGGQFKFFTLSSTRVPPSLAGRPNAEVKNGHTHDEGHVSVESG